MPNPEQNLGFADINSGLPRQGDSSPEITDLTNDPENFSGQPIVESESSVSFVGVEIQKGRGGSEVPSRERFQNIDRTLTSEDLRQMQRIAVALKLKQPVMLEEYSGSGKTTKVEHMCSLTDTEVHYANCHDFDADVLIGKMSTDETTRSGFGWQDGLVMHAIRNGGVLFLDEYNFMRGDVRARMHEILDALLRGKEAISLIENNHEIVPVSPDLRIIAAQNPPGGEFGDREVLDPAQYTRFVQIKGPSEMPKETKLARALGFINRDNVITIQPNEYLTSEAKLSPDQLAEIPGMEEILRKFIDFEDTFEQLVKNRQIGADQPQPIYSAFQRDYDRVIQFVQMFYNGDINETFQKALRYYYSNRLESSEDRAKVEELINHVEYTPPVDLRRRTIGQAEDPEAKKPESALKAKVEKEIAGLLSNPEIPDSVKAALAGAETPLSGEILEQMEKAKEVMGEDFIGPEEVKAAFLDQIEISEVPKIPFSKEELERAKELGQMLILRVDKAKDGSDLTMEKIHDLLNGKIKEEAPVLFNVDWYGVEDFYKKEKPAVSWALTGKEIVPDSNSKNYFQQTEELVKYLQDKVFKDKEMPREWAEAIKEFEDIKAIVEPLARSSVDSVWKEAAETLADLKINQMTRQTPAEALYDLIVRYQQKGERLMENMYTWTKRRPSDGSLVSVGYFKSDGVRVGGYRPDDAYDALGVSFSRSL